MERENLLEVYKYIRIYVNYHQSRYLSKRRLVQDLHHDIFLYLYDKGIHEIKPGTKRYIKILAMYAPSFLRRGKYSRKEEQILLDLDGNPMEPGISYFPNGDVLYDLDLLEPKAPTEVLTLKNPASRPILVTYVNNSVETFDNIGDFCKKIGCRESTARLWLRFGLPQKRRVNRDQGPHIVKDKYGHIAKLEHL